MPDPVAPTLKLPAGFTPPAPAAFLQAWQSQIKYFDDPELTSKSRLLVYSLMGGGKTHFLGTCPKSFVLDYDAGGKTLRKLHIPCVQLYDARGIVKKTLDIIDAALAKRAPFDTLDIETICFDSLSELSSSALTDFMLQAHKDPMETKASFDEWGKLSEFFRELGKRFRRLSQQYNVVCTALAQVEKDENTGICFGKPMLDGKSRDKIGAIFDEVYYLVDESVKDAKKWALYTAKYQFYDAKTRTGLPYRIEDPSFAKTVATAGSAK